MKMIKIDKNLVSACGLYCGACRVYLKGSCPGCKENIKAEKWCKVKVCTKELHISTCAECKTFSNPNDCKKFNNFISKMFKLVFGSERAWCIGRIKEVGLDSFSKEMAEHKSHNGKGMARKG